MFVQNKRVDAVKKNNMDLIKEKGRHYRKFPKYLDSQKICYNHSKI